MISWSDQSTITNSSRVLLAILSVALAAFLAGCERSEEAGETAPSGDPEVAIGAVLPLTGDIASYGRAAKKGIDLAIDHLEHSAQGGPSLHVIYEDNQGEAASSIAAFEKLVSVHDVPVVIGAAASSNSLALSAPANRSEVILISPISSSKELTEQGGAFFFRVCPSDVLQAEMMAQWLQEEGHARVSVIYVNNSWGSGLVSEFERSFTELGGVVTSQDAINEGARDLRAALTRVQAKAPDALYAITYGREGGALLRQARELGLQAPIFGADVWGSPELMETAGDAATGVGIIVPKTFAGARYEVFARKFAEAHGEPPDTYAAYAYDLTVVLSQAIGMEGLRGDALRTQLRNTLHEGVTGIIRFDSNGDVDGMGFDRKRIGIDDGP